MLSTNILRIAKGRRFSAFRYSQSRLMKQQGSVLRIIINLFRLKIQKWSSSETPQEKTNSIDLEIGFMMIMPDLTYPR